MSEEAQIVPEVPFELAEVREIECLLWGYGQYVRRLPAPQQDEQRLPSVESLRKRLAAHLAQEEGRANPMLLTGEEGRRLLEAMQEFGQLLRRLSPQDAERDSVIEALEVWQRRLASIVAEDEAT